MTEIYGFSTNQLKTLLLGSGFSDVIGIESDSSQLDNETVLESLNELAKKQYIVSDTERFICDAVVKRIVDVIGGADICVAVRTPVNSLPDLCIYPSEPLLLCYNRSDNISAYFAEPEELVSVLEDDGYICTENDSLIMEESPITEFEKGRMFGSEVVSSSDCVRLIMENTQSKAIMHIVDYYFYSYIRFEHGRFLSRELCTRTNLVSMIKRLIENDKC